jgi:hypothetical protein
MKNPFIIMLFFVLALTSASTPAESNWVTMEGKRIPESDAVKSRDGFNAMLLITSDPDWHDEWNTPSTHIPHFNESHTVKTGGELNILSFFSNPLLDQNGFASISCDFSVIRPDGSFSVNEKSFECFKTKLETDPTNLYLSVASLKFVSEETDPKGIWKVEVVMRDLNRGVELTLKDSFVNE